MGGTRLARCFRPWRIANSRMCDSEQVDPAANRSRYVLFLVAPHPATLVSPGERLTRERKARTGPPSLASRLLEESR
jgi:hypothetical protein